MSGEGEVYIAPIHFFEIVGAMRERAALRDGLSPLTMVDVADDGGNSYLEALVNAAGEARTMIASSLEVAGRALALAGTRTVDADMAEQHADTFWQLPSPYSEMPPQGEDARDEWVDDQREYYDGVGEYLTETEEIVGDGD